MCLTVGYVVSCRSWLTASAAMFERSFATTFDNGGTNDDVQWWGHAWMCGAGVLVLVICWFWMVGYGAEGRGWRSSGLEWLCGSWNCRFWVDMASCHWSFYLSSMCESHFVAAIGGNKKSANAVVFSNVTPAQLHRLILICIRRQIEIKDSIGGRARQLRGSRFTWF